MGKELKIMDKIGKIVGILVFLMIVGTSMVTAADEGDTSMGGENGDDDYYVCCAPVDNATKLGKAEDGPGWLYIYIRINSDLK
jgi:hypothetical protein